MGTVELVSVEFCSNDKLKPQELDQPLKVRIVDEKEQPIKAASVTVDVERNLSAKSATSDEKGLAILTPVKNELDKHTLHVEARDYITMDVPADPPADDPMQIILPKAMQVGGFVQDEQGKPVKNVTVRVISQNEIANGNRGRFSRMVLTHTDEHGQWLSPPLPWSDHVYLRLNHPDYMTDNAFKEEPKMLDELRSGIATIVIKK
jgi:hypothetical protein